VSRPKHLVEKRLGIAEVATGDALFELPDVFGELRGVGAQPTGQSGEQSIRELESLVGLELSAGQSTQHRVHLDHRR